MDRVAVESTNLSSVGYDEDSSILEVEFNDGSVYQYYSVPYYVFNELLTASSKGKYFHKNVKEAGYQYQRI